MMQHTIFVSRCDGTAKTWYAGCTMNSDQRIFILPSIQYAAEETSVLMCSGNKKYRPFLWKGNDTLHTDAYVLFLRDLIPDFVPAHFQGTCWTM
jgi:hypothetical protein